jgi:acetyl esterase
MSGARSAGSSPLVPQQRTARQRVLLAVVAAGVRVTLVASPRPAALLIRRVFAAGGAQTARGLARHAPDGIAEVRDEQYGDGPDELLDVFRPEGERRALPTVVWVHGGGFVGGTKDELAGYFRVIAGAGYAVVAPRYSLAPERHYPTPLAQLMEALRHVRVNAERLRLDPEWIVLAGDSAGAQLAAQLAALVTTPGYAAAVGVRPSIGPEQLRGLVLACGPYDLELLLASAGSPAGRRIVEAALWAYAGTRRFATDPGFATWSVAGHLSPAFPPALVTVGNGDPLRAQSELLVQRLREHGLAPRTVFFPGDHEPPLGHEYQFDLDTDPGRLFIDRMRDFLQAQLGRPGRDRGA